MSNDPAHRDPRFATSLAHGLGLIEAFANAPRGLGNAELARRSGMSRASVSRLTTTLVKRRIVVQDPDSGRYRLGVGAVTLAYPLLGCFGVRRLARLAMRRLADELGATVSLGVRDRHRVVYLESTAGVTSSGSAGRAPLFAASGKRSRSARESGAPIADFQPDVGAALPLLQSAMGRAWFSSASAEGRQTALADLRRRDPRALVRWRPQLRAAMADLERRGFCLSRGDWIPGIHAVAVPLAPLPDGERLLLNCGMAARRLRAGDLEGRVAGRLLELAALIDAERLAHPEAVWPAPSGESGRGAADLLFRTAWSASPPDPEMDRALARTLASGIDLLTAFSPLELWLGNRTIACRIGRSPQTVARLTHTLTALGYLHRDAGTARYRLGPAALAIAWPMLSSLRIRRLARPLMQALAREIDGAVSLGLRHDTAMVYVETAWRADDRLLPPDIGAPMPMLETAMGRAWLCQASETERATVLHRLRLNDPSGYGRYGHRLADWQRAFAEQGWVGSRDFRPEIEAFATPVAVPCDGLRYVLNCGVLAPRPLPPARARATARALRDTARRIRDALTGSAGHAADSFP